MQEYRQTTKGRAAAKRIALKRKEKRKASGDSHVGREQIG